MGLRGMVMGNCAARKTSASDRVLPDGATIFCQGQMSASCRNARGHPQSGSSAAAPQFEGRAPDCQDIPKGLDLSSKRFPSENLPGIQLDCRRGPRKQGLSLSTI